MYAVIETGGKQYRVEVGTELEVERLEVEPGSSITLDRVLLVADGDEAAIGRPLVSDAQVSAEVLRQDRGEKVIAFKYRPKARRRVKKGHRQELTVLRVSDIRLGARSAAETVRQATEAAKSERQRLEEAAARQAAEDAALAAKLAARKAGTMAAGTPAVEGAPTAEAAPAKAPRSRAAKAAPASAEPAPASADATPAAPKRGRARVSTESTPAESTPTEAPKRSRATKKDE